MEARGKRRVSITPIDPSQLLFNLRLSTGKAAEFCHISRRQLCYWTDKGIIEATEGELNDVKACQDMNRRIYYFETLRRVIVIKSFMAQGYGLREASIKADGIIHKEKLKKTHISNDKREIEMKLKELNDRLLDASKYLSEVVQTLSFDELRDLSCKLSDFLHILTYNEQRLVKFMESGYGIMRLEELVEQMEFAIYSKDISGNNSIAV